MRKKIMITVMAILLSAALLLSACGDPANNGGGGGGDGATLYVDLHSLMPTDNTISTESSPAVNASRAIAEEFKKQTGITIRWATDRLAKTDEAGVAEWYSTAIRKSDVPAIGFTFGTKLQDRGYYVDLTSYFDTPNEFVEGNTKWKDLFPSYLFKDADIVDAKGRIAAVPVALYPGTATGVFYNKNVIGTTEKPVPQTYGDFRSLVNGFKGTPTTAYAPNGSFKSPGFKQWINEFVVSPNYMKALIDLDSNSPDFNSDGMVDTAEALRGVKAGYFNASNGPNKALVQQMLNVLKDYYQNVLPAGWENATYDAQWKSGLLAMSENGLWNIRVENNRSATRGFDYGVFAMPLVDSTLSFGSGSSAVSGSLAAATQYYAEGETVESPPMVMVNIMADGAKNQTTIDNAVKFLKFLTVPYNNKLMADEQVSAIGAVLGAQTPNTYIADYMNGMFAKMNYGKWPFGYTMTQTANLNLAFSKWVKNAPGYTTAMFYTDYDNCITEGAQEYITVLGLDTSGW